ncbi:hypothetical protein ABEF93_004637 [Exophiala dermatitidis]
MQLSTQRQPVSVDRLTYRSSVPFETAEVRLRSSIQRADHPLEWTHLTGDDTGAGAGEGATAARPRDKESFVAMVESHLGPHGFAYFAEFNHGSWLRLFRPQTSTITTSDAEQRDLRCIRFILGNPLIAITLLRHDLDAGLSVPVELYLVEEVDPGSITTGTKCVWYRPSGLVAGYEGATQELVDAAKKLDAKLEALVRWVLSDD